MDGAAGAVVPVTDWHPIATAEDVEAGTVADLRMRNGEIVRAAWVERYGLVTAWWPLAGRRRRPIGLYEPLEWRRVHGVAALPS